MEAREGYKKTELGWIPEAWNLKQVEEIADVILSNVDKKSKSGESVVSLCNYMDVYNNDYVDSSIDFMKATATDQEIDKFRLKKDDVLITKDSETEEDIAHSSVVVEELKGVLCGYHLAILRPRNRDVDGKYLMNSIKSSNVHKYFVRLVNGVTRFGLNKSSISCALIPTPPLPEQQKIAEILTTVDDKISSIADRIQQTEQLKKGLTEKLLTEGIGHTEFKDTEIGRIPESWDVVKLKTICKKIFVGIATSTTEYYTDNGVPLIRNQNIKENVISGDDLLMIDKSFSEKNHSKKLLEGDVITVRTGYPGMSCVIPKKYEGCQTFTTLVSRPEKSKINSYYLSRYINSTVGKKLVLSNQAGGAQQNLNVGRLIELPIIIPSLEEQKQIANILSTVDDKLDVLQSKKAGYETLKKGLMEQLLTGKRRVKV